MSAVTLFRQISAFTAVTAASARFASVLQEGILEELVSFCHTTIRMSMLAGGLDTTDALREEALNGMLVCVMGHTLAVDAR